MRQDLLETVARRDGLHVLWMTGSQSLQVDWIHNLAQALAELGPVVLVDLARIIPCDRTGAPSILDVRVHQGRPDQRDDLTLPWFDAVHVLPTGIYGFPDQLEVKRLRNLLVNLQLLREQFAVTLLILPQEWKASFRYLLKSASTFVVLSDPAGDVLDSDLCSELRKHLRCPLVWLGSGASSIPATLTHKVFFQAETSISPRLLADQLYEARRVHVMRQNPPDGYVVWIQRYWWIVGLLLACLVLAIPVKLDHATSLFHELDAEKRLYTGKPFLAFRFGGDETLMRLSRHAIGRFTALVPAESDIREYALEVISKNHADSSSWVRDPSGIFYPPAGTLLRFYPPERLFNPQADSLLPAWHFFTSILSDSLAYVTEYYNPTGVGGRRHLGIDVAGRKGSRILAPFSGKAWTTVDERGGVVIALVNGDDVLLFMHCDQLLYLDGQDVFSGDPLATVGMTGHTTGPHTHLVTGHVSISGAQSAGPVRYNTVDPVHWVHEFSIKMRNLQNRPKT